MICSKNGIKQEGSSCSLNNCIYPKCIKGYIERIQNY